MAKKACLPLRSAIEIGESLQELLAPACERIEIVGSVRRKKDFVGDIELLAVSKVCRAPGQLFGDAPALETLLPTLYKPLKFELNPETPANGPRYKRLLWGNAIGVDLFICAPPTSWGVVKALRTGPWDFSKLMLTPADKAGALPLGFWCAEGSIQNAGGRLATPEEEDVFTLLKLPLWAPEERSFELLQSHLVERSRSHAGPVTEKK